MKTMLSYNQLHPRQKSPLTLTIIMFGILGLIVCYPLTGCASQAKLPPASNKPTHTPTLIAPTQTPTVQTPIGKLVWNDEFNGPAGEAPNPAKWTPETGGTGWGNQELDYDTNNQNAYLDGVGDLVIEARHEDPPGSQCWYGSCQYTSARLTTQGNFSFTYGSLVARIKLPRGQGYWPAFWLLGNNCDTVGWPNCGEIDIMEMSGETSNENHATVHGALGTFTKPYVLPQGDFSDNYHTFMLQWDPTHLYFYVDGINYATLDKATMSNPSDWVFNHPFDIVLDLGIGGGYPGNPIPSTVFPQKMYISYVRLYQGS